MNSDPMSPSTNWAAELREFVNRAFDTNEIHELAFDFNLDYDDLPGRGKAGKVVELLQILARQQDEVMGFDENGRFLASLFGFSVSTDQDAKFSLAT